MGLKSETQVWYIARARLAVGELWDLDPVDFFLRNFFLLDFFFWGDWSLRTGPPPSSRVQFHSASTAVLITPKGTEPPGSRRIGVIGALVLILPSETV